MLGYLSTDYTESWHKPKKCFKDVIKNNFRTIKLYIRDWEQLSVNQLTWKNVIYKSCKAFEVQGIKHSSL